MKSITALGGRIASLRKTCNFTQAELGARSGYSVRTIRKAEASKPMSFSTLRDIAISLDVHLEELMPSEEYLQIVKPNSEIAEQVISWVADKDVDNILNQMTDDISLFYLGPEKLAHAGTFVGKQDVRTFFKSSLDDIDWIERPVIESCVATHSNVVIHGYDVLHVVSNGSKFKANWCIFFNFRDDLICEIRHYSDQTTIVRALESDRPEDFS